MIIHAASVLYQLVDLRETLLSGRESAAIELISNPHLLMNEQGFQKSMDSSFNLAFLQFSSTFHPINDPVVRFNFIPTHGLFININKFTMKCRSF